MFSLPNLPTDNIYKFKFLGGVSILIFVAYIYSTQIINTFSKILETKIEIQKLEFQQERMERDSTLIKDEIETFNKAYKKIKFVEKDSTIDLDELKLNLLTDKNYREYLEFIYKHKNDLLPTGQSFERLKKLQFKQEVIFNEVDKNLINLKTLMIALDYELYKLFAISILSVILLIYGWKITKKGYNEWHELVQKPNDEKLKEEIRKLKSENSKNYL
jgi:hypothetical protein